jgi:hypothetical protein
MAFTTAFGGDGGSYDGQDLRGMVSALSRGRTGRTWGLFVAAQASPNNTIRVTAGAAIVPATAALGGHWAVFNTADVNSSPITSTGADPRKDLVILRIAADGGTTLEVTQGTPSGSPVLPTPSGTNWFAIGQLDIPASTTNITGAMVTSYDTLYDPPALLHQNLAVDAEGGSIVVPNATVSLLVQGITMARAGSIYVHYSAILRTESAVNGDYDGYLELRVDGSPVANWRMNYRMLEGGDAMGISRSGWVSLAQGSRSLSLICLNASGSVGDVEVRDKLLHLQEIRFA